MEKDALKTLTDGTRFRGFKNAAVKPALEYKVVKQYEFLEPLPTYEKPGRETPYTDYKAILKNHFP